MGSQPSPAQTTIASRSYFATNHSEAVTVTPLDLQTTATPNANKMASKWIRFWYVETQISLVMSTKSLVDPLLTMKERLLIIAEIIGAQDQAIVPFSRIDFFTFSRSPLM